MKYNELFDRETLSLMGVAKQEATRACKPAITVFMISKAIISNKEEMSKRVFDEMQMDRVSFYNMCKERIEEMPSVSPVGLSPYVDDELDDVVRQSVMLNGQRQAIAGSVAAETILKNILRRHQDELSEYIRTRKDHNHNESRGKDILARYTADWTELAREGHFTPLIGREKELKFVQRSLLRKTKNNPVLTGDAGTGKTAIVEGLAINIAQGNVPQELRSKKILALNVTSLVEEARLGGFREAILLASQQADVILFIDEMHSLPRETLDIMKPFMARGELKLIGATTAKEYSKILASDEAFARRLQRIEISELSAEDTLRVLTGIKPKYESHHGLKIGNDALQAAVSLSQRYITNRYQPDKSIDLMDEAAAKVKMAGQRRSVCEDDIREIVSQKLGMPVERIGEDETTYLQNLEQRLSGEVLGQPEAVSAVSRAVRRSRVLPSDDHRAPASFLFFGPSGVGKTALAQALSKIVMGSPNALIRLDMSEYRQSYADSRLIGSPPGYVGHLEGGQLTEAVSRHPYSVVLFDEIEKANPSVFKVLYQVLDYGRLTDGRGRSVDFTNTIIIFTSNLSEDKLMDDGTGRHGFFTPEFMNRLSKVVHFNKLEESVLLDIARKMLKEESDKILQQKGIAISFDPSVEAYIVNSDAGYGQGARYIRHAIEEKIEDSVVDMILSGTLKNKRARMSVVNGELNIQAENR